jgi:hypothetical protein
LVVDLDSTICAVCGKAKHGAGYGYTKELGYHPLVATRAGTGELVHIRMRKGSANTQRGAKRFIEELVARLRRAGATGELVMRFDSGFWSNATIATLGRLSVGYTMGVRMVKSVVSAVSVIDEASWTPIDYTCDGIAEVAECVYKGRRLIVRRTRLVGRQATLWPEWRHFAFLTDQEGTAVDVDAFHRAHATVEARTVRTRYLSVPGRLVNIAGIPTLRAPLEWPWAKKFSRALDCLRALPPIPV